ncbi:MAG: DUF2971 domain-containing protein [Spirochaetales bacterium]|nr:DUF2971 domain-containing protein [Spirochaetales bacterium]
MSKEKEKYDSVIQSFRDGSSIFHYTTNETAINYLLPDHSIKFSMLENTNDPYEYKFTLTNGRGWGETSEDTFAKWREATPVFDRYRRRLIKVACFCTTDTSSFTEEIEHEEAINYGCCKPRMWAQYGENNYGVCIVFNKERLTDIIKERFEYSNADLISYESDFVKRQFNFDLNRLSNLSIDEYCRDHIKRHSDLLFFRKHADFQDEREYRIVFLSDTEKDVIVDIEEAITTVVIGDRFPDGQLPALAFHCTELDIPCYRVNWDKGRAFVQYCGALSRDKEIEAKYDKLCLNPNAFGRVLKVPDSGEEITEGFIGVPPHGT